MVKDNSSRTRFIVMIQVENSKWVVHVATSEKFDWLIDTFAVLAKVNLENIVQFLCDPLISHLQIESFLPEVILGQSLAANVDYQIASFSSFVIWIILPDKYQTFFLVIEKHMDNICTLIELVMHRYLTKYKFLFLECSAPDVCTNFKLTIVLVI